MSKREWGRIPRPNGYMRHHVIVESRVRRAGGDPWDVRNCIVLPWREHFNHHAANPKLKLDRVPDCALEFAAETLGAGPAYNYLARYYDAEGDPRLNVLLALSRTR